MKKRNTIRISITARIIALLFYIIILTYFLFFAEAFGRTGEVRSFSTNFVPFKEILRCFTYAGELGPGFFFVNFLGNIIAFIPFGFLFTSLLRFPMRLAYLKVTLLCAAFSATMEFLQFITMTGTCDVDDVILNTAGGFIGFVIYYAIFVKNVGSENDDGSL